MDNPSILDLATIFKRAHTHGWLFDSACRGNAVSGFVLPAHMIEEVMASLVDWESVVEFRLNRRSMEELIQVENWANTPRVRTAPCRWSRWRSTPPLCCRWSPARPADQWAAPWAPSAPPETERSKRESSNGIQTKSVLIRSQHYFLAYDRGRKHNIALETTLRYTTLPFLFTNIKAHNTASLRRNSVRISIRISTGTSILVEKHKQTRGFADFEEWCWETDPHDATLVKNPEVRKARGRWSQKQPSTTTPPPHPTLFPVQRQSAVQFRAGNIN